MWSGWGRGWEEGVWSAVSEDIDWVSSTVILEVRLTETSGVCVCVCVCVCEGVSVCMCGAICSF